MSTFHVFAKEIPWNPVSTVSMTEGSYNTISEAINAASEGDSIVVHEGVYREKLDIDKEGLTITNFEDEYVLVTGLDLVTGFKDAEDHPTKGVKVAEVPESWKKSNLEFSQVFINGVLGDMARHPNRTIEAMMDPLSEGSGYGSVTNVYKKADSPLGHITFKDGLPNVDLKGGILRGLIGKNRQYPIGWIESNDGDSITFTSINKNHWTPTAEIDVSFHKFGYAMVMHKNLIDYPGEWFLEGDKIYYLPMKAGEEERIEMQVRDKVLEITASKIVLQGINFKAGYGTLKGVNESSIRNCSFRYLSPFIMSPLYGDGVTNEFGICMDDCNNNKFEDDYLAHTWGSGFVLNTGVGNLFKNCIIEDIGWIGTFSSGIFTTADKTRIEDCTFKDNGRFQIRVRADGKTDIIHNEFSGAMSMSEDAGAISSESSGWIGALDMKGSEIAYNKIHDVKGFPVSGGGYSKQFMLGIYLEDVENYTAHHNLIYDIRAVGADVEDFDCAGAMLYMGPRYNSMHKPIRFYNNTAWNCDKGINLWNIEIANFEELRANGMEQEDASGLMSDGRFANNIFPRATRCDMKSIA
ncbi:MAG: hypothetical protein ATN31_11150 [Candidatus Epulonipiscioides saccharophilum]|nr:MAG: hypothetical protein ATN31_11150 [Epulopiscium sp. AS2M-Bin001]